jgi:hypothetical protein
MIGDTESNDIDDSISPVDKEFIITLPPMMFERWGKKVKLSLCLTKHHAMKTNWGSGGIAPRILDLGTGWRWVVSFTHLGGWVGPRAVLDAVVKRKIPIPRRESNPRTPIIQPVAQRCTDWAIKTRLKKCGRSDIKRSSMPPGRCVPSVGTVQFHTENL